MFLGSKHTAAAQPLGQSLLRQPVQVSGVRRPFAAIQSVFVARWRGAEEVH